MLLCGEVDNVAGRVVWLLGWVVFLVVGLFPVVWVGGVVVVGSEPGSGLEPVEASVPGAAVCELLSVAGVVTSVWPVGLVDGVLFTVTKVVVTRVFIVVCVIGSSELEVVAAL